MSTQIAEYSPTEAALADLSQRYKGVVFDVTTRDGLQLALKGRAELRGYRVALEKKRVELKAPALERSRLIDAEAKRITAELEALENPIDEAIKSEESRKERERAAREQAERERVAGIQTAIADIGNKPAAMAGWNSADLAAGLENVRGLLVTSETFAEFLPLAEAARDKAIQTLSLMLDGAKANEAAIEAERQRAEAERAELVRLRDEQRVREAAEKKEREEREAEDKKRRDALAAEEAASKARIAEAERAAAEQRASQDAEANATRAAEEERQRKAAAELREQQEATAARAREVEAAELELMNGEAMLVRFVERFGKRREFAGVAKAIKAYQDGAAAREAAIRG